MQKRSTTEIFFLFGKAQLISKQTLIHIIEKKNLNEVLRRLFRENNHQTLQTAMDGVLYEREIHRKIQLNTREFLSGN